MDFVPELHLNTWLELGIASAVFLMGCILTIKSKVNYFHISKKMTTQWNLHTQIHERLTELRCITDCARVTLVQFHNGEYFMDGVSMAKLSCTHESLTKGVSSTAHSITNVLISLHTPMIEKILKDSPLLYFVKDEKEGYYKNLLESVNVTCYMIMPVKYRNMISGYVSAQWCSPYKNAKVIHNIEEFGKLMLDTRNQIQVHLNEQLRSKK